jgi:hypothetical protein
MSMPTFTGLKPYPEFNDVVTKINTLVGELQNLMLSLDSLNVVSLTADHIDAGTLNAALVTVKSMLNAGAYIQIDGTGMKIFDGTKNTLIADITGLVTMTGTIIKSATGYPRVELNSANNLIAAFADADTYVAFLPAYNTVPALVLVDVGTTKAFLSRGSAAGGTTLGSFDTEPLNLQPSGTLQINGVNGFTGTVYVSATSGGPATTAITFTKGIRTS